MGFSNLWSLKLGGKGNRPDGTSPVFNVVDRIMLIFARLNVFIWIIGLILIIIVVIIGVSVTGTSPKETFKRTFHLE